MWQLPNKPTKAIRPTTLRSHARRAANNVLSIKLPCSMQLAVGCIKVTVQLQQVRFMFVDWDKP